jgi:hypothetical protein
MQSVAEVVKTLMLILLAPHSVFASFRIRGVNVPKIKFLIAKIRFLLLSNNYTDSRILAIKA